MAKPDCDDGWYKKSIELEAALDFADFTKLARTILRYGFAQIFGQGRRPRYMKIHPTEIAERIGKHRQHVHRALDELIKSNALVPVPGQPNTFRFVKDYERWTFIARVKSSYVASDILRLTPREVADCRDSISYSRSFELQKHADGSGTNFGDTVADPDESRHQSWLQAVTPIGDKLSPRLVPDAGHIRLCDPIEDESSTQGDDDTYAKACGLLRVRPELIEMDCIENESRESRKEATGMKPGPGNLDAEGLLAPGLLPDLDGLSSWVRSKLAEQDYGPEAFEESDKLCLRWLSSGGDPEWCAQAFQASLDNPNILDKADYARGILRRMYREARAGEPVLSPAFCDYRPDRPTLAATGTAPAPAQLSHRPTKAQRDAERAKNRSAWLKRAFPSTTEEPGGQG